MQRNVTCSTRKNKAAAAVQTAIALDYTGVKLEHVLPLFEDGLVIARQAQYRRMEGAIPTKDSIKVLDFVTALAKRQGAPEVVTVEGLESKVGSLSQEEQLKFFTALKAKMDAAANARK